MAGQARRFQGDAGALAGNHVVIALGTSGPHVLAAHLRRGSSANVGDTVHIGQRIGQCRLCTFAEPLKAQHLRSE